MRLHWLRGHGHVGAVLLLLSTQQLAAAQPIDPLRQPAGVVAPATPSPQAVADYRRKLEAYILAREAFEAEAGAYWNEIADKRRMRNAKRRDGADILIDDYVRTQPPVYVGPPRPVDPSAPKGEPPARRYVPVVTDFLLAAAEHFRFVPQRPQSERDYKLAYARVAAAAGLTRDQVVRIYGFESGGNGPYDVQAGLERPSPTARAITTALGYNQLLGTNTVEIVAESGDRLVRTLKERAAALSGAPRKSIETKIAVLQRMVAFCRSVPDSWSEHERLANTPKGLGVHAMVLDIDVGPLLQTQKLLDSVVFARRKGYLAPLTAAELEMMNLTGDGNGIDMVMMPAQMRPLVPTANFFQRGGYERNPVAIRNNVVATLLAATNAKMDKEMQLQGAKDLAAAFAP